MQQDHPYIEPHDETIMGTVMADHDYRSAAVGFSELSIEEAPFHSDIDNELQRRVRSYTNAVQIALIRTCWLTEYNNWLPSMLRLHYW
jgi:hypothetical protein